MVPNNDNNNNNNNNGIYITLKHRCSKCFCNDANLRSKEHRIQPLIGDATVNEFHQSLPPCYPTKRIIRNISKSHFKAHTDPIFKDLGILKFNDILLVQLGQFMYCKNSFLPPRANDNFSRSNQFHSYNTRNSQAYRLPY